MSDNSRILVDESVQQQKVELGDNRDLNRFFEFYALSQALKEYDLSYDEIESGITGDTHDGGADAVYLFVNGDLVKEDANLKGKYKNNVDVELVIAQVKNTNSFSETPVIKFSRLSTNLLDFSAKRQEFEGRYNTKILDAFELFRKTYFSLLTKKPKLRLKYLYVTKGDDVHPNVGRQAEDLKRDITRLLANAEVNVEFIGADDLLRIIQTRPNEVHRLKVSENPLSSLGQVFIVLVNLADYFRFITDDDGKMMKYLFESNVRDYQGKTNVNTEIRETLEEDSPDEFWWLNNGVTIVASEASAPGGKELVITNPEIVNGLQTSNEIYGYYVNHPDKLANEHRNLLVRVIVPQSEETRDKIIRATNSQTPIPKASLRATDAIHRQIEDFFKNRGLYYDRRKNYYKNEGKKPKEIISVSFLAQCLMSVLRQKPDFARARPSTLLENKEEYNRLYRNNDLMTYFNVAQLGRNVELTLRDSGTYNASDINNVKFYVLYFIFASLTSNLFPTNKLVSQVDLSSVSKKQLDESIDVVYGIYNVLGANDTVAKGSLLLEELTRVLRNRLSSLEELQIRNIPS
ncbi:MAG: hypothetical protein C7B45_15350 [Sulfobacillus acidophilus]|uniref:Abortive phage infection protein C-terminal domain-containing protein n=1 Tax=Sulfobacillus acidophilus TaxID=53633 RepID=A0A2T2WDP1_9FIRM|nr:MAG: hypothetical protein C7B45_15350 [Sulfobacillus acidophilus]